MYFPFISKVVVFFLVACTIVTRSAAQQSFPATVSYEEALQRARRADKLLFLIIHPGDTLISQFPTSFSKRAVEALGDRFVSGVVPLAPDSIYHPLHQMFHLLRPIYLFADADGIPLLRYNRAIRSEDTLMKLVDSVLVIAEGETMGKLLHQYHKGVRSRTLLTALLKQYQAFDMYADQQVLNHYLSMLSVQELNNFETVVFLLGCGPSYDSNAYRLARTNNKMVDSLYATLPLPERKRINGRIIEQTFRESLDKRVYNYGLGQFVAGTWRPHYLRTEMGQSYYPMEYKRLLKDTSAYINAARNYYNAFYYRVSPDSLAKLDFAHQQGDDIPRRGNILDSAETVAFLKWLPKHRKRYESEQALGLNVAGCQFLVFGKGNPSALFDAIRWQQKAVTLRPDNAWYRHTLALLLYQVGFYAQAEAEQKLAMTYLDNAKASYRKMHDILERMQARTL